MVEADAAHPLSVMSLPILAELVLRKLNRCPGSIAQIAQAKTKVPHRRAQEGFGSGTASVHAGLLIPLRIAPSAALSEQVRVTGRSVVLVSGRVCPLIVSAHATRSPASRRHSTAPCA
ncbi:Ago2 [Symbiodinium sp. CCMP2456]|nr:Ago2 [Symbiodinium sp. CCMP2456]